MYELVFDHDQGDREREADMYSNCVTVATKTTCD